MAKHKHLTLNDRQNIEHLLNEKASFRKIGKLLDKDPSTISKEIRAHIEFRRVGGLYLNYNACKHRFSCEKTHLCHPCHSRRKFKLCKNCLYCNSSCKDFERDVCSKLLKPPYVCNGCGKRMKCTLEKRLYSALEAHNQYRKLISEARSGISLSEEEILHLDEIVTPLLRKKQSPHHICVTNKDTIMISERTLYRLIDARLLSAMNLDLPRKVRYRPRKKTVQPKIDRTCRIGRDYDSYLNYSNENPGLSLVQLDSVEGKRGGKALLTIHFVKAELMLAFLRDHNDSRSVIDIFERLYLELQPDRFLRIFQICLADNGSEFSNPKAIEYDMQNHLRTRLFYCQPNAPYQKGSAERNHEFIRCFLPKGTDLGLYTQDDISLMMDHINSYSRESLGDKSPYEMFEFLYGKDSLDILGCRKIPPQDVTLNKSIFHKEVNNHA